MKSSKRKPSNLKLKRNANLFLKENSLPTTEMEICSPNDSGFETDYPSQESTSSKQEMLAKIYEKARHSNFALSQFNLNDPVMKEIYCERLDTLRTNRRKQKNRSKQNVVRVIDRKTTSKLFVTEKEYKELLQLQTNRNLGMYALCDDCNKMRYLAQVKDPLELPEKWYCGSINISCSWDEMLLNPEEAKDLIYNKYSPGSIVFGKIEGYPWWPAIVNDDPEYRAFYKLSKTDNFNPIMYHVTFFEKSVKSAWLNLDQIVPFKRNMNFSPYCLDKKRIRRIHIYTMLRKAFKDAEFACTIPSKERLLKYSALSRSTIVILQETNNN